MFDWRLGLVFAVVIAVASAADNCKGSPNTLPLWTGTPTLLKTVPNGKLYTAGEGTQKILVLHVYGSAYEWGRAQGQLLKDEILNLHKNFTTWIESQADQYLKFLPLDIRHLVEKMGMNAALDFTADLTKRYTPKAYFDEVRGLAEAIGESYEAVMRFQMFPELTKAACTIVGAWGKATGASSSTAANGLLQMRLLDFGIDNPMRLGPVLTVYHPVAGDGHPFAIQTFAGYIGAITGYSGHAGVSEKVWIKSNETQLEGRSGTPWMFVLRDILQYDATVTAAMTRMENTKRTCSIFVGVGSNADEFRLAEYSDKQFHIFGPSTPFPGYVPQPPQHPLFDDLVYVDKHTQPSGDPCTAALIQGMYGSISPERVVHDFAPVVQSGDLQAAVYDYANNFMHISVATPSTIPPIQPAYDRQFLSFNMTALFAEAKPTA